MAYITMADLTGKIPGPFLIEALDDDQDGAADPAVLSQVIADAEGSVDAILGTRFTVPFLNPLPAPVVNAAKVFACELIYQRRGKTPDQNPFTAAADQLRDPEKGTLTLMARGELPLTPALNRAQPSGTVISAPAATTSKTGRTAV